MKPGRELDALIHERVMGHPVPSPYEDGISQSEYERRRKYSYSGPEYSTDIKAAWEVVERFSSRYIEWNDSDASWSVGLHRKRALLEDCAHGYGDTAPHAICLAALKACGVIVTEHGTWPPSAPGHSTP